MEAQAPASQVLTKQSTRASLTWFNWSLMLRGVFDTTCGGTTFIFVAFALALGVPGESVGRFTIAASLGCLSQMVALPLLGRVSDRKRYVVRLGIIEPIVLVGVVLSAPLLPDSLRLYALTFAVFAGASFLHMTRPVTDDWLASTIPGGIRGRYLGRRFQLFSVSIMFTALATGFLGDLVSDNAVGLAGIVACGGLFGILAVMALSRAPMAKASALSSVRLTDVPRTLADVPFRRFVIGILMFHAPMFMCVAFYQVFYLSVLEMNKLSIAAIAVVYQVIKISVLGMVGKRVDRIGPRRVALLCGPTFVLFFALMAMAQPGHWWLVLIAWALVAIGDGGFAVASQAALFHVIPREGARPAFFAVISMVTMGAFAVGAGVGEWMLRSLNSQTLTLGPWLLGQYHLFFGLAALMMIPASLGSLLLIEKATRR